MKGKRFLTAAFICAFLSMSVVPVYGESQTESLAQSYAVYQSRLSGVKQEKDIESAGFRIIENHKFPFEMQNQGMVTLIPAIDKKYNRLVLFLVDENGDVFYRTDQLEANNQRPGQMKQQVKAIAAVSFQDINGDQLTDIILIASCGEDGEENQERPYKVGDVLFQSEDTKTVFYRDYRISGKINRYNMNKSIGFICSYVRDGFSTEFLYTSTTLDSLIKEGFQLIPQQCYWKQFEKLGRLQVVSGTYKMAEYTVFQVYLVNEQGYSVWNFQPMGNYENLYELKGVSCQDIDGDGLKDVTVLADYSWEDQQGITVVDSDYQVYYQENNGFRTDSKLKSMYTCSKEDKIKELVDKLRGYWGWKSGS